MASQITSLTIVYPAVYSGADQGKHQSSASLAFVRGIHRWPVNSPQKWSVTWKVFPFHDVINLFVRMHLLAMRAASTDIEWIYGWNMIYALILPIEFYIIRHCSALSTCSSLRPRQNGHHFADDIFKCIFLNKNLGISLKVSLKFVPTVRSHYMNQWLLVNWRIYAPLGLNDLISSFSFQV